MAFATTYTDLINEVKAYVDNTLSEFTDRLPNIVARAQDIVQGDLDLSIWNATTSVTITGGTNTLARGSWLKVHSMFIPSTKRFIELATIDKVRMFGSTGAPRYYAEWTETNYLIGPTPSSNTVVDVTAMTRLAALSTSNESNWISTKAPELLFWQTLIGAESFLIAPERVAEFRAYYGEALTRFQSNTRDTETNHYTPIRRASPPVARVPGK